MKKYCLFLGYLKVPILRMAPSHCNSTSLQETARMEQHFNCLAALLKCIWRQHASKLPNIVQNQTKVAKKRLSQARYVNSLSTGWSFASICCNTLCVRSRLHNCCQDQYATLERINRKQTSAAFLFSFLPKAEKMLAKHILHKYPPPAPIIPALN